jgi:hypothetical protein
MGLTVSAEEIIRDRKILKRESFLNLSWNSYLTSKVGLLFLMSAIQTITFVLIGHLILEIQGMTWAFWFVLFTCSCFANILGLNISAAFNSAVTVYVMIPLLLIPQMILSGLLFNFDRLNDHITTKGKVPVIADLMASRWAYEAMAVYQFKNNAFEYLYYDLEQEESQSDFKAAYIQPKLMEKLRYIRENYTNSTDSIQGEVLTAMTIVRNEMAHEPFRENLDPVWFEGEGMPEISAAQFSAFEEFLTAYKKYYQTEYNATVAEREKKVYFYETNYDGYNLNEYKNEYYNESLSDLVTNANELDRIIEYHGRLLQLINPVFNVPEIPGNMFNYRTHFFAPQKYFAGRYFETYWFNVLVIWLMSVILYITLYTELLRKFINWLGNISFSAKKK